VSWTRSSTCYPQLKNVQFTRLTTVAIGLKADMSSLIETAQAFPSMMLSAISTGVEG
jgi:hypothetical protein